MEITSLKCRQAERLELRRQARQKERQGEGRTFFRRIWVLYSLAVLGLGLWDFAFARFHPLRTLVVLGGGVLSVVLLVLMRRHERGDRHLLRHAALLQQDADSGEFQRIHVTGIRSAWRVEGPENFGPAYVLRTGSETVYVGGPAFSDALDEYYQRHLLAETGKELTIASSLLLEQWPHSRQIRLIELIDPPLPEISGGIAFRHLADHLPNGAEEEFAVLPEQALSCLPEQNPAQNDKSE